MVSAQIRSASRSSYPSGIHSCWIVLFLGIRKYQILSVSLLSKSCQSYPVTTLEDSEFLNGVHRARFKFLPCEVQVILSEQLQLSCGTSLNIRQHCALRRDIGDSKLVILLMSYQLLISSASDLG